MKKPIKIMHIDGNWRIVYIIIRAGGLIKSGVPLKTAIDLLKKEHFDLIISEPHQKAALTPQAAPDGLEQHRDLLTDGSWQLGTVYKANPKPC
jgi:hypothetical protein